MSKKTQDYDAFVEKFKPKKTTDDCYTPPLVYEAVAATQKEQTKALTKRSYPPCVLRAAMLHTLILGGVDFSVQSGEGTVVR